MRKLHEYAVQTKRGSFRKRSSESLSGVTGGQDTGASGKSSLLRNGHRILIHRDQRESNENAPK